VDYQQARRQGKLYAAVPTEMMKMPCSLCVHLFTVLDHPDHREKGCSIEALRKIVGANWDTADWHVRHHLEAAGWVCITEAIAKGGRTVVKVAHNPSECRNLHNTHTVPLAEIAKVAPGPTSTTATSVKSQRNLSQMTEEPQSNDRGRSVESQSFLCRITEL
jgi:hypothetical protein